ncbi:MAG TPA: DegT/DnrJ/EryC1/StrS aminotransferase family protein [Acidobacteriota bacterium]|nr:DegT/DnrJ/EryC1/StrS aminotransferase family protein [Acidobacteriota bacterium]HNT17633.1 DegT/DnrJ/EryC1/StrS aminotransferase family protein [Acidobacteriota bacterium]
MKVPFFRPNISDGEINEVVDTLRSGWLTTGPKTKEFEERFARAVGAPHALALNSCTAALHLALEALGLREGQAVVVPTMTFAATAEVVRYMNAEPLLADVHPDTLQIDLEDAERRVKESRRKVVGIMPVHIGGMMADMDRIREFAERHSLWIVEDAAHSFPSAWRKDKEESWRWCGRGDSKVTCFSFYANKTITTGEGGMATTHDPELAERMRIMSLHGISKDAWKRFTASGSWYYEIVAPGFKYNLTDVAASIGLHQLERAEEFRKLREDVARRYRSGFEGLDYLELPPSSEDRIHSWHLFYIRLRLDKLKIDRARFIDLLKEMGIITSVHWMPLHLHPYYRETYGFSEGDFPEASRVWKRLISLPIFPGMKNEEVDYVIDSIRILCEKNEA